MNAGTQALLIRRILRVLAGRDGHPPRSASGFAEALVAKPRRPSHNRLRGSLGADAS